MIIAVIQARMSSKRFPGKVLQEVLNKPLLWYLVERLKLSSKISRIIIATTTNKVDSKILDFAQENSIECFRGDEIDVLSRYYYAAIKFSPDYIIRITADCPLVDPQHCDLLISRMVKDNLDYACLGQTFAEGSDIAVFTFKALKESHRFATAQPEREHVTLYINQNDKHKRLILENSRDDSQYRYTIDERIDLQVVEAILNYFYKTKNIGFSYNEIIEYLTKNPQISQINQNIIRNEGYLNSLRRGNSRTRKRYILFRVDGSKEIGWGHVMRCIGLAEEFKNVKIKPVFIIKNEEDRLIKKIISAGFKVELIPKKINFSHESNLIIALTNKYRSQSVIIDLTNKITLKKINSFKKYIYILSENIKNITLIDGLKKECLISKIRLPINIAVVPYVGAENEKYLKNKRTSYLLGVKYSVIRNEFTQDSSRKSIIRVANKILILPGGSNNILFVNKVLDSFTYLKTKNLHIKIVSNNLSIKGKLQNSLQSSVTAEVIPNSKSISDLYKWADIAVSASGLSMYELAFMGVPAIIISNDPAHSSIVDNFLRSSTIIHLGPKQSIAVKQIASEIDKLLIDKNKRTKMSLNGRQLVDGKGARRIVSRVITKELV